MKNKLTTPKAILIGSFLIAVTILYTNNFNFLIIPKVKAEVAGMDKKDLIRDRDFRKAVQYIVEDSGYIKSEEVKIIVEDYNFATRSGVLSIVEGCLITKDGQRVTNSCY